MTDNPPQNAIFLDEGHAIVLSEYKGDTAGINEWHRKQDGAWCRGWVAFNGSAWAKAFSAVPDFQGWDIVQREPLTLTPSILCRVCGSHGFITNGKWVAA
jgi:uncharacterized protein DUF6527